MDTPTHALIPVIAYGLMRQEVLISGTRSEKLAVVRTAVIVGLVGALPDMVDPHVTLAERLRSWSHCLTTWVGFSALLWLISLIQPRWLSAKFALGLSLTYLSHLFGDAIAGGIGWSYPLSDATIGDYYVHPRWWIPLNYVCVIGTYIVFRVMPMWSRIRRERSVMDERRSRVLEESRMPPPSAGA
ncbi:MAG: metal-dependent hydrolase [Verrucomicrobiales bacterium]